MMKMIERLLKQRAWAVVLAALVALGMAQTAGAQTGGTLQQSDQVSVVDAFHGAGDDIEAALALLTDDVEIRLEPPPPNSTGVWKGKVEARAFFEWRNAQNIRRIRVGIATVEQNNVLGRVNVFSNGFTALGLGSVGHTFEATLEGGKLKFYYGKLVPEELLRINRARIAAGQPPIPTVGMPRTGDPVLAPLIMMVGILMLGLGYTLRRRRA
jgi:hypothetical protein